MNLDSASVLVKKVQVATTSGRGHTPEELAQHMVDKIVHVGSNSHPVIRDQAVAFKEAIKQIGLFYLQQAVIQDRTTIAYKLREAGYPDLIHLLGE